MRALVGCIRTRMIRVDEDDLRVRTTMIHTYEEDDAYVRGG